MGDTMETQSWEQVTRIPSYMVIRLGDSGMIEEYNDGELCCSNHSRIHVEILAGHKILIPNGARIIIEENGDLSIEILK